jgi:hypothetical protein
MRWTAILGIILMGMGIVSLAYFVSPLGLPTVRLVPTILGGVALIAGIVLSFGLGRRTDNDEEEP